MPTQRPFLSNFLAAFRTHTPPTLHKATSSIPAAAPAGATSSAAQIWTSAAPAQQPKQSSENAVSSPRPIHPSKGQQQYHTSAAAASTSQDKSLLPPLQHTVSPQTHLPASPVYGPPNKPQPSYPTVRESRRARRGSDSSSDSGGFRNVRGAGEEKWFIGGKSANGEERYYKLGMVKRERSADRISADQLSL